MRSGHRKSKSDLTLIGKPQRRIEGLDKSTGRAVYADDIRLPGMLHGKILRSPHPHARVLSIDTIQEKFGLASVWRRNVFVPLAILLPRFRAF